MFVKLISPCAGVYGSAPFSIYILTNRAEFGTRMSISLFIVKKGCCCSGYAGYIPSYYPPPPVFNTGRVILHPGANKLQKAHFFAVVIFGSIPPSVSAPSLPISRGLSSLCMHQLKGEGGWSKKDPAKRAIYPFDVVNSSYTNGTFLSHNNLTFFIW